MDLINILNRIIADKDCEYGKSLSNEDIQALELELGMNFADSYKLLLKRFGFISSGGITVFGVSEEPYNDIVKRNKKIRNHKLPEDFAPLPSDAYIISHYPGGGYYVQYAKGTLREGQIGLILDETFYEEDENWPDLESFLEDHFL